MSKKSDAARERDGEDMDRAIGSLEETGVGSEPDEDPEPAAAAPSPPGRNPNSTPEIQRPKTRKNVGIAGNPPFDENDPNAPMPSAMATENANDIRRRFEKWVSLGDIHGLGAYVYPLDGTPMRQVGMIPFTELLTPDRSPGDVLQSIVTDRIHRRLYNREMTYEINFGVMRTGKWISRNNKLYLGSPAEMDRLAGTGDPQRPAYVESAPAYRPPPAPHAGAGYAPPAPASPRNPELDAMMDRVARTEGALNEVLGYLREERNERRAAAGLPPAPAPAPAPAAPADPAPGVGGIEDLVARGVVRAFKELGAIATPPGAPPPAPPSPNAAPRDPFVAEMESVVTSVLREGVATLGKTVREQFRTALAGVGAPPPAEPAEPIEPPDPEPAEPIPPPPFHVTEVGSKWPDGSPVMYATDDDGNMDLKGIAFANPIFLQQGLKVVDKLTDTVRDFASKVTLPNGSQVVNKTPRDAVDANPRSNGAAQGVGAPPQSPNNPHPPSPPPPKRGFPQG